ncbi:HK97-gp10 family putative phage morphogenesis protein [Bacillota bacterium Meth-B3]
MQLNGADDLKNDLIAMADALSNDGTTTAKILKSAAQPILEQMIQNASSDPRPRSGNLRGALRIKKASGRRCARVTIGVHAAEGGAPYANPVEFGHGGPHPAPPHPFVRPAFDARAEEAYGELKILLNEALDKRGLLYTPD